MSKNLLFTSAGDNTEFYNNWLHFNKNYDVWVVYYGKNENNFQNYKKVVNRIWKNKGSKFQNFYKIFKDYFHDLMKYDRFFILDDDIIINTNSINVLFYISKRYNLEICQPAFITGKSLISHEITGAENGVFMKYTNFIEVNAPLFSKNALLSLMKHYDTILLGWGIDFLYIWANGMNRKDAFAVIDFIRCINPDHRQKKNKSDRELNQIKDVNLRAHHWGEFAKKKGIPNYWRPVVYKKLYMRLY